ncbi:hypothetical protein GGR42_000670 [Saonia flava]|uniref:Uncharacterized protein n=1 Tax=Saonia flava TaxID=523696 RepID=A0A846QQ27_9FLAO|nr:hypothetical protein [Saonia flava]
MGNEQALVAIVQYNVKLMLGENYSVLYCSEPN